MSLIKIKQIKNIYIKVYLLRSAENMVQNQKNPSVFQFDLLQPHLCQELLQIVKHLKIFFC